MDLGGAWSDKKEEYHSFPYQFRKRSSHFELNPTPPFLENTPIFVVFLHAYS